MTGEELLRQALYLLNYTNNRGEIDTRNSEELIRRGVPIVNAVLADVLPIAGEPVSAIGTLEDTLPVAEDTAVRVMVYGVAMWLAQSEADGDNQQLMASIYSQKRNAIRRSPGRVADVLPVPGE